MWRHQGLSFEEGFGCGDRVSLTSSAFEKVHSGFRVENEK